MFKGFGHWFATEKPEVIVLAVLIGIVAGNALYALERQTRLLEGLYTLAREQRRLLMASVQREYQAAAAAAKESDIDG